MAAIRRAQAIWEGDLLKGKGQLTASTSGAFKQLPVTWASRAESPDGKTSPEELLAAAHAACFAMAFSMGLASAGSPPQRLEVSAAVTFDKTSAGWRVVSSALEVRGTVPGLDAERFASLAAEAKEGCPVSQALKGNVQVGVTATLAS